MTPARSPDELGDPHAWLEELAAQWWKMDTDEDARLFAEDPVEWLVRFGCLVLAVAPNEDIALPDPPPAGAPEAPK